jgi:hypothetical protein
MITLISNLVTKSFFLKFPRKQTLRDTIKNKPPFGLYIKVKFHEHGTNVFKKFKKKIHM